MPKGNETKSRSFALDVVSSKLIRKGRGETSNDKNSAKSIIPAGSNGLPTPQSSSAILITRSVSNLVKKAARKIHVLGCTVCGLENDKPFSRF